MIALLDTNVILDALMERSPFDIAAKEILRQGQRGKLTCSFTANAATDIFYLYSKARSMSSAKTVLHFLLKTYSAISITHEDCVAALSLGIADFEDALVAVLAYKVNADYIITCDKRFLAESSLVKIITPNIFVATHLDSVNTDSN